MMRKIAAIVLMAFVGIHTYAVPPVVEVNNRARLMKLYGQEQQFAAQTMASGKCWYLIYTMTAVVRNPMTKQYQSMTTNGSLQATKDVRYMTTDKVVMLMDRKEVFTVYKDNRTVTHGTSDPKFFDDNNAYMEILRDSVLKQYNVSACKQVKETGKTMLYFLLQGDPAKRLKYTSLELFVDEQTGAFQKIHAVYNPEVTREIKEYTLVVKERGSRTPDPGWQHIAGLFITPGGKLKHPYESYTLKDLTVNNKKKINR